MDNFKSCLLQAWWSVTSRQFGMISHWFALLSQNAICWWTASTERIAPLTLPSLASLKADLQGQRSRQVPGDVAFIGVERPKLACFFAYSHVPFDMCSSFQSYHSNVRLGVYLPCWYISLSLQPSHVFADVCPFEWLVNRLHPLLLYPCVNTENACVAARPSLELC